MHPRHSLFATKRKQLLTHKNMLRPLQDEADAAELAEEFIHSYMSYEQTLNPDFKEYSAYFALKLKQLALRGVRTAVKFYQGLFSYVPNYDTNIPYFNYSLLHTELLNHIKEIGIQTGDAYLLFHSYAIRIHNDKVRDFEEAFNCLMLAANMNGAYATRAASCLAYLYGKELASALNLPEKTNEQGDIITGGGLIMTLNDLFWNVQFDFKTNINQEKILACLRALGHFGSKEAHQYLASLYSGVKCEAPAIADFLENMETNSTLSAYHQAEANKLEDGSYLKQEFLHYFNLVFKKSMEPHPAKIPYFSPGADFILDLNELIDLHILVTNSALDLDRQKEEKNKYDEKIREYANEGELGAMHLFLHKELHREPQNNELVDELLKKIISTPSKHKNVIIAMAAEMIALREKETTPEEKKALQQNAARLGSYWNAIDLGLQAFKQSDFVQATRYFNQTIDYADLYETPEARHTILFSLNNQPLDTKDKIEFYFQFGADTLKDMTDISRLACLEHIMPALKKLFPDENNRPEIVNNWFTVDVNNTSLLRTERFFPFLTSPQIDMAFKEIIELAKNTLEVAPSTQFRL